MTFASLLIGTCTIRRYTAGSKDDYGQPAKSWADHKVDESCRLMAATGREITIGAEIVIAEYKLFLGNIDVTEQDRVIIGSDTYEILLVIPRQDGACYHHKELLMRLVR